MYLIDTNILAALKKRRAKVVAKFISNEKWIYLSDIVAMEGYFGAAKVKSRQFIEFYDDVYNTYSSFSFDLKAAKICGFLKGELAKTGKMIEDADIMIAATALANDLVLVTNNTKHFERIEGLKLENWLE